MRSSAIIFIALAGTLTLASNIWPRETSNCPAVWTRIASEFQDDFNGCGADAHLFVRATFHDCINNGCDGSLVLTDECSRHENIGLSAFCNKVRRWSGNFNVSAADIIQFGAATAMSTCLGPRVQALVGRIDSSKAADVGTVPGSHDSLDSILKAFSDKGFSANDVVALMATHSIAVQFNDDPAQSGKGLDSTHNTFDNTFYSETQDGTAPSSLQSDILLSNSSLTAETWTLFGEDVGLWTAAFTQAWSRFAVIGNDVSKLQDCSSLIPISSASKKRQAFNVKFTKMMRAKFRL